MTLPQILTVLRARWLLALGVLVGVVALVAAANLLRTPQYTATGTVVLDVKSPDPIAGVVLPGMTVTTYMGTQLGVMQSDRVALLALKSLQMDKDPALQALWMQSTGGRGDFMPWLVERTMRTLEVLPTKDSNIMSVAYTAADPVQAAEVANAFVKAFIDVTLELRVEPARQYSTFFDARGKHLRDELEQAQTRLSAYQQKHDIVASDQRFDVERVRLAELSTQLVLMQGLANDSGSRQSQVGTNGERLSEVVNNPLVVSLNTELARQEARFNELNEKLGTQHPQVLEMQASVAQARARLALETRRVASSVAINNSVNQSRLALLRDSVEAQRAKVLRLKGQGDELTVLQRDVESAQRAYDTVQTRAAQTSIESQATQTNVSVLKHATPAAAPSSPRLAVHLLAAVFVGALLALAAVLLRESADRRLRSATDVTLALRQPLLAVLPRRAQAPASGRLRFSALQLGATASRSAS